MKRIKIQKYIYLYVISIISLLSCESKKQIQTVFNEHSVIIHNNIKKDDVKKLISNYFDYSELREQLLGYFFYDKDYSNDSYHDLVSYYQLSQKDSLLSSGFENIIRLREYEVLNKLSSMTLEDIGDYYRNNSDEHTFLHSAISNSLLYNLEEYNYHSLHQLHYAFIETDLIKKIDSIYLIKKKSIQPELKKILDDYCQKEQKALNTYKTNCIHELFQFSSSSIEEIAIHLLDKNLPIKDEMIDKLFADLLKDKLNNIFINKTINNNIKECLESIKEGRSTYISELIGNNYLYHFKIDDIPKRYISLNISCPKSNLRKLIEIQNRTDYVGWALTTASIISGFLSGGLTNLALDMIDMGYSYNKVQKEKKEMEPYIKGFIIDLDNEIKRKIEESVNSSFANLEKEIINSQESFKNIIYDNY